MAGQGKGLAWSGFYCMFCGDEAKVLADAKFKLIKLIILNILWLPPLRNHSLLTGYPFKYVAGKRMESCRSFLYGCSTP